MKIKEFNHFIEFLRAQKVGTNPTFVHCGKTLYLVTNEFSIPEDSRRFQNLLYAFELYQRGHDNVTVCYNCKGEGETYNCFRVLVWCPSCMGRGFKYRPAYQMTLEGI